MQEDDVGEQAVDDRASHRMAAGKAVVARRMTESPVAHFERRPLPLDQSLDPFIEPESPQGDAAPGERQPAISPGKQPHRTDKGHDGERSTAAEEGQAIHPLSLGWASISA